MIYIVLHDTDTILRSHGLLFEYDWHWNCQTFPKRITQRKWHFSSMRPLELALTVCMKENICNSVSQVLIWCQDLPIWRIKLVKIILEVQNRSKLQHRKIVVMSQNLDAYNDLLNAYRLTYHKMCTRLVVFVWRWCMVVIFARNFDIRGIFFPVRILRNHKSSLYSKKCCYLHKYNTNAWVSFLFPQNQHSIFICEIKCNFTRLNVIFMHKTICMCADIILVTLIQLNSFGLL